MKIRYKTDRAKLAPKTNPYYELLSTGRALGYRKRQSGKAGRWLLRTHDGNKFVHETLGEADDFADADGVKVLSYQQALKAAVNKNSADPSKATVADALEAWALTKEKTASSDKAKRDDRSRAERIKRAFPNLTLKQLRGHMIKTWRDSFLDGAENPQARMATADRNLAVLKSALTDYANTHSYEGLRPWDDIEKYKRSDSHGSRLLILSKENEDYFITSMREDISALLRAMQLTGARPKELQQLICQDLEGKRLSIPMSKTGQRTISLDDEKAAWFRSQCEGKPPTQHIFLRQDGEPWPEQGHTKPIRLAVKSLDLPNETSAYVLRHGFISAALSRGVPIAAVAKHCGTSVEMIMRTYAKFVPAQFEEWFA